MKGHVYDMASRTYCTVQIKEFVRKAVGAGQRPAEIYRLLADAHAADQSAFGTQQHLPTQRTIERLAASLKPKDLSGLWIFSAATAEQQRLVPEVLSYVFDRSNGRVWLTNGLAELVTQVRMAAPDIPVDWAYHFAQMYWSAKLDPESEWVATYTLGHRPWDPPEGAWVRLTDLIESAVEMMSWEKFAEEHDVYDERSYQEALKDVPEVPTLDENGAAPRRARLRRPN